MIHINDNPFKEITVDKPTEKQKSTKKQVKDAYYTCPNCKSKYNGTDCPKCGFDATEIDIY